MRVLVTGGNGQLGRALKKVLPEKDSFFVDKEQMDITDKKEVLKKILKISPQVIIHCAAYTDVDGSELNQKLAFKVNRGGAANVAAAAKKISAAMVYISTDYVFDGRKKTPYSEAGKTNPLGIYGQSKLAGERQVQKILKKFFIVRTAWLYGEGKNFPKTILNLTKTKKEINVVSDQFGSPTYTLDLARGLSKLILTQKYGLYHFTNSGSCSWFQFAQKILKLKNKNNVKIIPITTQQWSKIKPGGAPRPNYTVLNTHKFQKTFKIKPRSWQSALKDYMKENNV
ncbi:MAG: dTDP-4-dehydrorhamnose reductase [Candidatus Nealsonbacteria bacterium CG23_combo_of_CG06-09_8_20_14_all_40_13]|uniref:dTDP-4-dehydrorhamnose reductase n=1 Tax=Candidatus Nealsonbacteria bacterium CG23_combo_of_CG06-09_8_20_14_all_40_13 TaxID=1974724 RepID=A0A2G9YQE1_9BACT|nr:MAG: dTDP-4-dehydrorhamnose reductase [Candidatus Nealsonbacteria bacterium CG23_combo_of_CG06-09_8_20_14_all_40_13]PIR71290.1 MAG: dTDP-4-dehydrorhamnose reductase [Candidatus Nealsonbacteria bacterium CG10_big_fil_rev_8_21_14_0_10_40_24]PIU43147.1 MAG: dTDP-4-dehydrorhamnose reductase [Candidatus Nealsonbacteria bacterium CG07_land_8_20_14_0_80_40_10]